MAIVQGDDAGCVDFAETVAPEFGLALQEMGLSKRWSAWTGKRPVGTFSSAWESAASRQIDAGLHPYGPHQLVMRSELTALLRRWTIEEGIPIVPALTPANGVFEIDATGRAASIARRRGGARRELTRVIALLGSADSLSCGAAVLVEALEDGWCFAAPGRGGRASIGFYTDRVGRGGRALQVSKLTLSLRSSQHLCRHVDPTSICFSATVLASSSYVEPVVGRGWLAVGDAAFASDPLSSSGLTFAAESAVTAARFAAASNLAAYERFVAWRVARFRIERQRVYAAAAHRFHAPFWAAQAALTALPLQTGRPPPIA